MLQQQEMMSKMINQCVIVDEEDSESDVYEEAESTNKTDTVVNHVGSTTVEISNLDLLSDRSHLGFNDVSIYICLYLNLTKVE